MSNSVIDAAVITEPTDSTLAQHLRVSVGTDGFLNVAAVNEQHIGTVALPVLTAGDKASVITRLAPGTRKFITSEACEVGDVLWSAAAGKVADTDSSGSGGYRVGVALTATTGDNQIIEAVPIG